MVGFAPWSVTWLISQAQQWTVSVFSTSSQLSSIHPFILMCSLLPKTAPVISAPCWEMHRNKERLDAKERWLCFPNQITTFLLFLYDLYVAHVGRMTGRSLLKEIGINNKYNIMKITQGKKEALGAAYQPVSTLPVCGNETGEGLQLKNPYVLWEPSSLSVGGAPTAGSGYPSLAAWQRAVAFSVASLWISSLPTNLAFPPSSPPRQGGLSCGMQDLVSTPVLAGMGGKRVGFGLPWERPALLAQGQWSPMALHPSLPGRAQQSPAHPPSWLRHC